MKYILLLITMLFISCGRNNADPDGADNKKFQTSDPVEKLDPVYAENFRCRYYEGYKVLEVTTGRAGESALRYYLSHDSRLLESLESLHSLQSLQSLQSHDDKNSPGAVFYIKQPVEKIVSLSSQNLTYLSILGKTDRISGIDSVSNINNSEIIRLVQEGRIKQVGEGRNIDTETLTVINPDIIFASWTGGVYDSAEMLAGRGFTVAAAAEWLEKHPLARAEWLVFISAFFDMEEEAYSIFRGIEENYLSLQKLALSSQENPPVFVNMLYSGSWGVPGGRSFMARFFKDAGGEYVWADNEREGTLFYDFETVLSKAGSAEIWLVNSSGINSLKDIAAADSRYSRFRAFRNGAVYNNNLTESSSGNLYWEEGSVYPDRILSDLIKIFHPAIAESNDFYYFKKLK